MRVVLASHNAKKLTELQALFEPLGVELLTQSSLGVPEAAEPHATFVENALEKARHASRLTGLPALADDSGLSVEALGGAPGVLSARYATLFGGPRDDAANNEALLRQLGDAADRRARFVCVLVALRRADDPEPLIAMGRWEGEVLRAPRGHGGFGYDPLMWIPALGASVAELDAAVKNRHSHRAQAAQEVVRLVRQVWLGGGR